MSVRARAREWAPVAALLAVFFIQAVSSMRLLSATWDEFVHLAAGYSYLKTGDLRLNPEHPPLMKELCALPLLSLGPQLDLRDPAWSMVPPDQTSFGYDFLYRNDADRLLFWGRMPVVILGVLLGLYVYLWARDLSGRSAALLALFLYSLCPNMIAHARFVTMDVGLSFFFIACLYHAWRYVRGGRKLDLGATGVALGLALGAKFSAAVLVPVLPVLFVLAAWTGDLRERRSESKPAGSRAGGEPWVRAAVALGTVLVLAAAVVWIVFRFPSDLAFYLDGMRQVNRNHQSSYAEYLMGDFALNGWWYYFVVAFLVKTPVPTLLLLFGAVALTGWRRPLAVLDEAFLVIPAVAFFVATSAMADNLGVRYLLPVYPLAFIFASRLAPFLAPRRIGSIALAALVAWTVVNAARIWPDHLAYFNELAGGPANGHRWLEDSNIDWGVDLKRLGAYQREKGIREIRILQGPWHGNPDYYGLSWKPVRRVEWETKPEPGVTYAMSTHMLIRGEQVARQNGTRSNWLSLYRPVDRVGYSFYVFRF